MAEESSDRRAGAGRPAGGSGSGGARPPRRDAPGRTGGQGGSGRAGDRRGGAPGKRDGRPSSGRPGAASGQKDDRENRGGSRLAPKGPRLPEPRIPEGVTGKELDRSIHGQLRTLSK